MACTTVIGRAAACAASCRARICARHHTMPDAGTCASARALDQLSPSGASMATESRQPSHAATCAVRSAPQRSGHCSVVSASITSCSRGQSANVTVSVLSKEAGAGREQSSR